MDRRTRAPRRRCESPEVSTTCVKGGSSRIFGALGIGTALGAPLVALVLLAAAPAARAESLPEAGSPSAEAAPAPSPTTADPAPASASGPASASASASAMPKKSPPPGFEPVSGASEDEAVDAGMLVAIAYATFFLLMFGYIIVLARRQAEMAVELSLLAQRIAARDKPGTRNESE
ncbi:MAG: hypothetical protein IPK13_18970 [Deltaproteobacteria bacterium]|nr:hypothetical protein [Deltaproteobacteria bacterium]